jgi:Na+/melibiose symporter-like transporter
VPAAFILAGILIMARFPITKRRQRAIRSRLARRDKAAAENPGVSR